MMMMMMMSDDDDDDDDDLTGTDTSVVRASASIYIEYNTNG